MGALAVVGTLLSAAVGAVGAISQANAQAAALEYNAKVEDRNARLAEQNRQHAVKTAMIAAEDNRRESRRTLSAIRTAYGASGLELAGSPLDVIEDSALELSLDTARIEHEGRMRSREGDIQATGFRESAVLKRMEASAAKRAGMLNAFGYLAGAAGKIGQGLAA